MNERILELRKQAAREVSNANQWTNDDEWNELFMDKLAELIVQDYAKKTIQGLMSDPAFVQAMDEYYENKWAHRFD